MSEQQDQTSDTAAEPRRVVVVGPDGQPVGMATLPGNMTVEIECIVEVAA